MKKVLFLCVANSARSQMAEGLLRHEMSDQVKVESAGSFPSRVHPFAIQSMKELGIDISSHRSKGVNELDANAFDYVITLCQSEVCPALTTQTQRLHWPIEDPARGARTEDELLDGFREARDKIQSRIRAFFKD